MRSFTLRSFSHHLIKQLCCCKNQWNCGKRIETAPKIRYVVYNEYNWFALHGDTLLIPRGRAAFGQYQESRLLAGSNTESPWFTLRILRVKSDKSDWFRYQSVVFASQSEPESHRTCPEVANVGADQKERGLWERERWDTKALENCFFFVFCFKYVLGAGSRQYCRYTQSPWVITPLKEIG